MFVFIAANSVLPIILLLNIRVTLRFMKVRTLSRRHPVERPERLIAGWWLGNISSIFAFAPMIYERRIFVQNHWWLVSYAISAVLSITGLLLMNSGLGKELHELARFGKRPPAKRRRTK